MTRYLLIVLFISLLAIGAFASKNLFVSKTNPVSQIITMPTARQSDKSAGQNFPMRKNELVFENIFKFVSPQTLSAKNPNPDEYTLIATGDIIPARMVNLKVTEKNDFKFPFEKTKQFLKSADIVFANLESPLMPSCKPTHEGMVFCGDSRNIEGLVDAGINVVSLANNHSGNYGIEGVKSTTDLLMQNNISVTGNGNPAIISVRDVKFGFLGYNWIGHKEMGISWAESEQVKADILALRPQVNFVIVTFHWGTEYVLVPSLSQIEMAHLAIDIGADLIIGNHPHWVQGIEKYKNKYITYAHGNYVFDQMWSQETREGVLGKYVFNKNGIVDIAYVPIIIDDYVQPRFATQAESEKILGRMRSSSNVISKIDHEK